ncbi:MFS transporter [Arsenicitalea aurantiaca]|uniref:MFS transporter n=1 Tax=Arsenicitalea aurantiaca TaxID=1783274 RepID=A0A433X3E2_9HYPH|nr:MFS transporter [Arsenicitalea aurantiaca]RUT28576.1 MFS transporter [Arsenicitalea aurantiaca]
MSEEAIAPVNQSAFRHGPFRWYFGAGLVSFMGMWFEKVALGWFAWELTESTFWTGFVAVAATAPVGLLGPVIGVYAERWDMRRVSVILNVAMAIVSAIFFYLAITPGVSILPVAALALVLGVIGAFYHPVRLVLVTQVVPRQFLPSAVGLMAVAFNLSRVIGPALAGLLIAAAGLPPAFIVNAVSYLPIVAVIAVLPLITRPQIERVQSSLGAQLRDGLSYALNDRLIRWCLAIVVWSATIGRGALEIMPAVVGGILSGTSSDLAIIASAGGLGALAAAMGVGILTPTTAQIARLAQFLLPVTTLLIVLVGLSANPVQMAIVFCLLGLTTTVVGIGCQMIVQLEVAEAYRARVLTWWSTANFGGVTFGGLVLGSIGDVVPLSWVMVAIGILGLGLALPLVARRPR